MKLPRKLKKGFRSLLKRRETKWKRKARNIARKELEGFALHFIGGHSVGLEPGGIVSNKPINPRGEYVMSKDEAKRLEEMLKQPEPETIHVKINLDDMSMALKKKLLRW
jgi:hypothetical protein